MIAELGHFALILALCLALVQTSFPLLGAARGIPGWMAVARPAAHGQFVFLLISFASLISVFCNSVAEAEKEGRPVDYAQALHKAKRWVRRQEKWQSPYYWGTFVLVGPN